MDPLGLRDDVNPLSVFLHVVKMNEAISNGEEGVVFTPHDVLSGVNFRPALAHEDMSRAHKLAAEVFHTKTLRLAVTTVAA